MSMHGSKVRLVNGKGHFLMDDNYTTDFNEKEQSLPQNPISTEIKELTLSNLKLIEQLKALNKEVDMKVVKLRHVTSFMTPPSERSEEVLVSTKLEAAKKMLRNCEKEIERIKAELATKTGYEKVLELEAKSSDLEKVQAELQRNVAALHKKVTVSAKELALHNQKKSEGIFQIEEKAALIALNKMREKSVEYEQQLKAMVDGAPIREGKIKQLNETADELQKKIAQLKKEAAQFKKNSKGKELNEKLDKEKVKVEIERAKAEVDATQKKFKEEKVSWDQQLEKLKEQLRTLEKVIQIFNKKINSKTAQTHTKSLSIRGFRRPQS
eukprot:TRINITY_DN161_c2_g1_i1.p3 TRINITY_DN161_c2_g1~~TRINITY_DN161_c2_g1_i1.p3  ORF type:complete len:325 (+),score=71.63 TRINITY_DN161_c2_g1_i1:2162-3136(+)